MLYLLRAGAVPYGTYPDNLISLPKKKKSLHCVNCSLMTDNKFGTRMILGWLKMFSHIFKEKSGGQFEVGVKALNFERNLENGSVC